MKWRGPIAEMIPGNHDFFTATRVCGPGQSMLGFAWRTGPAAPYACINAKFFFSFPCFPCRERFSAERTGRWIKSRERPRNG